MRDYHVGTHYSIYIKLRRLLLLFHARLFLTKFFKRGKIGHAAARDNLRRDSRQTNLYTALRAIYRSAFLFRLRRCPE